MSKFEGSDRFICARKADQEKCFDFEKKNEIFQQPHQQSQKDKLGN